MAMRDVTAVAAPVPDRNRAKTFYVELLGFELIHDAAHHPVVPRPRLRQAS
jgi:catechol 2,3-dioxygenase-like lactoylglutathione lyase family enzyme